MDWNREITWFFIRVVMEFEDGCRRVELPHEVPLRWQRLQALYQSLQSVKETKILLPVLLQIYQASGRDIFSERHTPVTSGGYSQWNPFDGLKIFLDDIATNLEKCCFFEIALPTIISLASLLDRYAPSRGLQLLRRQKCKLLSLINPFVFWKNPLCWGWPWLLTKNRISEDLWVFN